MADLNAKWTCEKCTYENFPAASKCVVCSVGKRSISTAVNIYNLIGQQTVKTGTSTANVQSGNDQINKKGSPSPPPSDQWICSTCTLMNGIWLDTCSACHSQREGLSHDPSVNQKSNSSSSPPSRFLKSNAANNGAASTTRLASYLPKWRCPNCTYDNYPKSSKCSMCQRPKGTPSNHENPGGPLESEKDSAVIESVSCAVGGHTPDTMSPHVSPQGSVSNLTEACGAALQRSQHQQIQVGDSLKSSASGSSYHSTISDQRRRVSPTPHTGSVSSLFINACKSICDGDSEDAVNVFLLYGGDPRQKLSADDIHHLLDGAMACEELIGQSLLDLAVAYKRDSLVHLLLTAIESIHTEQLEKSRRKPLQVLQRRRYVLPCQLCPDLASDVRFLFGAGLRQAKEGAFPCYYFARDPVTFSIPQEVYNLPANTRKQLFEDIIDQQVQNELESEGVVNWSAEVVFNLGSRLCALNNRAAGDCLLDSVMQTVWGVMDRSNVLRRAMSSSLYEAEHAFSKCWRSYEGALNERLGFTLDESQWNATWQKLLDLANSQGQSLEELHIFVLAHLLRRPIIVYSPNFVTSRVSGDKIGESSFQGVYLPLLWDRQFCHRNPIALAYTLGHFSALVAVQSDETTVDPRGSGDRAIYLPLQDCNGKSFPVHFSPPRGPNSTRRLLTDWLDCWKTCRTNMLVAQQKLNPPPLAVRQMLTDWLTRYSSTAVMNAEGSFLENETAQTSFGFETINLSAPSSPNFPQPSATHSSTPFTKSSANTEKPS